MKFGVKHSDHGRYLENCLSQSFYILHAGLGENMSQGVFKFAKGQGYMSHLWSTM